jgi:hypothetical protein
MATKLDRITQYVRLGCIPLMLGLLVYVVLQPDVAYATTQRAVLFLLGGLFAGLLVGAEIANRLELKVAGVAVTLVGAAALSISAMYVMWWMARPEEIITAFEVSDELGEPLNIVPDGVVTVTRIRGMSEVTVFKKGTIFAAILNRDDQYVKLRIKPTGMERTYSADIKVPESARVDLRLVANGGIQSNTTRRK